MSSALHFDGMSSFVLAFETPSAAEGDLGLATPADAVEGTATDLLMSPATTAAAIEGYAWVAETGTVPRSLPMRASAQVIEAAEFGVEAGVEPIATTAALNAALAAIADLGSGRILQLPYGPINISANDVSSGEGTAIMLGPEHSNVHIRGSGRNRTIVTAGSNKVELFAQVGADNLEFSDFTFDNPAGILQNQPLGAAGSTIGGGVANHGNTANAAIRQYTGEGIRLSRMAFKHFCICCHYIGNNLDNQILEGDTILDDLIFDDYVQGLLVEQAKTIRFTNIWSRHSVNSINVDTSVDPGHAIYISNRTGAHPEQVLVANIMDTQSFSSSVKIRKGRTVVIQGVTSFESGRGIEVNNCERAIASDLSVKLAITTPDSGRQGINFDNCGMYDISNAFLDIQGTDGWGLRLRTDPVAYPYPSYPNRYGKISNVTIMDDFNSIGKAGLLVTDQTDLTIEDFRLIHVGSAANTRYPIQVVNSTRVKVFHPRHIATDGPPIDADNLVSFDAGCTDCAVVYFKQDLSVPPTTATISDLGTNTTINFIDAPPKFPNGTVAAPSITFVNDQDNGLFLAGTNVWGVAAGGVQQMRLFADRVQIDKNIRPITDNTVVLGASGAGWKSLIMSPQATAPSSTTGNIALSDGTASGAGFGTAGAGLYRWNGAAWVFVG